LEAISRRVRRERFIEADHVRDRSFAVPTDFVIENVLHGAFGVHVGDPAHEQHVVIEFGRAKATLVFARSWHPTQVIEHKADGRIVLAFSVTNLASVVSWVLEWGPHARVIEPAALVVAVKEQLAAALGDLREPH
jgi:predicted DNA-binding transcriptional regulator YafY